MTHIVDTNWVGYSHSFLVKKCMKCQYIKFYELGILNYLYKASIFKLNFKTDSGFKVLVS